MTRKSGRIPSGAIKLSYPKRIRYFYELSKLFPSSRNSMTPNGYFYVHGTIQANDHSKAYKVEFQSKANSIKILLHGIDVPHGDLKTIPHIFTKESDAEAGTVSLCLYLNRTKHSEFHFGDNLQETIIPWIKEWIYFYELFLMTGKWYGNGKHPQKASEKTHK